MRKIAVYSSASIVITAIVAALACTHGSAGAAGGKEVAGVETSPGPFLYRLEKDSTTLFLLGTVHVGVSAERDLPPMVWKRFTAAPCFVMEADQGAIDPKQLYAMAELPPSQDLEKLVNKATWTKVNNTLGRTVGEATLHHWQPWFVSILYLQSTMPPGEPMDGVFLRKARDGKKTVAFLEDWKEAISAFASVTTKSDLEELVASEAETQKQTDQLIAAYRTGDEAKLEAAMAKINESAPDAEKKMKVLLQDRNEKWSQRLGAAVNGKGCFVAVGAGHLVGKGNLRGMLAKAGYKISRVARDADAH